MKASCARLALLGLLILTMPVIMSGCWDQDEITSLASISGLGIDQGSKPGYYRISAQISPPGSASPGAGGGGGGSNQLRVLTVEAESLLEGFALLQSHTRREPFFLHLGYIVFGSSLARAGVGDTIGALQGWTQIRGSTLVFVAERSAEQVMKAHSGIGRSPGEDVTDLISNIGNSPVARKITLNDIFNILTSKGIEVSVPIIELTPLRLESGDATPPSGVGQGGEQFQEIIIGRTALFQRDRWVETLDAFETQILSALLGQAKIGVGTMTNPADGQGLIAPQYESFSFDYKLSQMNEEQLELVIKPELEIRLLEVRGKYDLQQRGFRPIESAVEFDVGLQISNLMQKLQSLNIDAIGVGQRVSQTRPKLWKETENRWEEVFPTVQIRVEPNARVRTTGLIKKFFELRR